MLFLKGSVFNLLHRHQNKKSVHITQEVPHNHPACSELHSEGLVLLNRLSVGCETTSRRQSGESVGF